MRNPLRPQEDCRSFDRVRIHVDRRIGFGSPCDRDDQLHSATQRIRHALEVRPPLEPVRRIRTHFERRARRSDALRIEMRAFEHHVCRLLGNFRFASTHDTTNRHRGLGVADGRHGGVESAFFPVERCDLLAFATAADDDLRSTEPRAIERMHRLI